VLAEHDAEFIVVGAQAETLMGSSRVTYDVDLCYQAHATIRVTHRITSP